MGLTQEYARMMESGLELNLLVNVSASISIGHVGRGSTNCFISFSVVNCGPLTSPSHGQVSATSTTFGSVASYICDTGYNLQGPDIRTCQVDGIWSGTNPTCESE